MSGVCLKADLSGASIADCEFEARLRDLVPEARKRRLSPQPEGVMIVVEHLAVNRGYAHKKSREDETGTRGG